MRRAARTIWLPAALVAVCAWLAIEATAPGDYKIDAGTAVDALTRGDLSKYFSWHPMMGPLGTLFQAPWSLLGAGELGRERWAAFGCLLVLAALAWYLAEVARRRGVGSAARALIAFLCVCNPITFEALQMGHPEELLTAGLAVGAVVAACEKRTVSAAVLLGLAVATKQWAVIAIFPVLMALPARRVWTAAVAAAIAAVLYLPYVIADLGAVTTTNGAVAGGTQISSIWSLWYAASELSVRHLAHLGPHTVHAVPAPIEPFTHLLIIGLVVALPLGLWAWRGRWPVLRAGEAVALFALPALLRCTLDPNDNLYYHLAFLIALIAWDAVAPASKLPLRTLAGVAVALLFWRWERHLGDWAVFNAVYLAVAVGVALMVGATLFRRGRPETLAAGGLAKA